MLRIRSRLAIAGIVLLAGVAARAADAEPDTTYGIKATDPAVGTMLRRNLVMGNVPFDKRYEEMTPEQRERVKAPYEAMAPTDEPPFPADGLAPMMKALQKEASARQVSGPLVLVASIAPDGRPRGVEVVQAPADPQFRDAMTTLLMQTRFKPAVCGGRACAMGFPLEVSIISGTSPAAAGMH